ncbi:MAG: M48 family metalloprotease [Candidatus Heimdallarchaeota archaeon]|nr:M48 family metalloprotease [Candidatus Heimdallarchaeota archaeon]
MVFASIFSNWSIWFSAENYQKTIGFIIAIFCFLLLLTELYTVIRQKESPDMAIILSAGVLAGLVQGFTADVLLAILVLLCCLMVYSVWSIRQSPVWRELMIASLISYSVILVGRIIQVITELKNWASIWGLTGQQWFGIAWNSFIYVFFIMCIIFFGRRFFLVSRLTSPQIIYLMLFAISYLILYQFKSNLNFYYPGVKKALADRLLFASFGTYEIMIVANLLLYLVSGPFLQLIFGVKKVDDERIINLVEEVKQNLGITRNVKVGFVKAPIMNAFAFGAFFDKRIAFIANDLDEFSNDDIRGIAGHELAHAKNVDTFWLFLITTVTFGITKAIQFPATTLDYIFQPDVGLDFLWYYLYSLGLLVFSYFFVRILEGRADGLTMRAGYGTALAKGLIKLEGFYQGIASEMGLSVYLLTDKQQTKAERIRFLGDAGRSIYNTMIQPSKVDCFINLIASHPKSAFRVAALAEQKKLSPVKAAFLPILLLIPFVRKKYLKELHQIRNDVGSLVDETFEEIHGPESFSQYDELSHVSYQYNYLQGKEVVAISKLDDKDFSQGKVIALEVSKSVSYPVSLKLKTANGERDLPLNEFKIYEMAENQRQVFKDGRIGTITKLLLNGEKFEFLVAFNQSSDTEKAPDAEKKTIPGIPVDYLQSFEGKKILLHQNGITRLAQLHSFNLNSTDISLGNKQFTIQVGEEQKTIQGQKFILDFKPFDIYMRQRRIEDQRSLIEWLPNKPVAIQSKDDLDTLLKGKVTAVTEDSLDITALDTVKTIKIDRIEFLYLFEDTCMLFYKPSLSFIERIIIFFQNRKKLAYIIP